MEIGKYKDKYFSILGDSISTFEGISVPKWASYYCMGNKLSSGIVTAANTWWGQVLNYLQGKLLVNHSISGSTVTWHPSYEVESYGCSDERTSALDKEGIAPNVIIVWLGINDWGAGVNLINEQNPNDLKSFFNAYKEMLRKLKRNYSSAEIWCITPAVGYCSTRKDFEFPYYRNGYHMVEYCNIIRACAVEEDCKIIDLYNNAEPYDTIDGFHPNVTGMKTIADAILKAL